MTMRIAVIADIHGNDLALTAVLDRLTREKVDLIINLGDALNGPINPGRTAEMLREINAYHVRGNGDRMVLQTETLDRSKSATFARARVSVNDLDFVASWPAQLEGDGWFAFHGSPRSDTEYLLEEINPTHVSLRSAQNVAEIIGPNTAPLILCAHSHLPRAIYLHDNRLVVNPGSVGLPAYSDILPYPHRMESGSPHARFAIVEQTGGQWSVSLLAIPYDWEQAAIIAERNGFPDWSPALRSGYA